MGKVFFIKTPINMSRVLALNIHCNPSKVQVEVGVCFSDSVHMLPLLQEIKLEKKMKYAEFHLNRANFQEI
jgi:hypothetical protein